MSQDPLISKVLGERYRVDELIGSGAMGRVYRAEHVLMRKRVALKILHPELTAVPEIVQRFEREARAAARIDHPHVATATDFGKLPDGGFFLVLEFVEGMSLCKALEAGPMEIERVLGIAQQVASALESAHAQGIVHRDLKPDNLLLVNQEGESASDFVKVLDFGIAKVPTETSGADEAITKVGVVYGTPEYMAPEQALGQEVDARADLYALGVVMYEMLAGRRPYEGPSVGLLGQQLSTPLPRMSDFRKVRVPPAVEQLVVELLAIDVKKRVPSATHVRQQLEALLKALAEGKLSGAEGGGSKLLSVGIEEVTSRIGSVAQSLPEPVTRAVKSRVSRAIVMVAFFGAIGVIGAVFLARMLLEESTSSNEAEPPMSAAPAALRLPAESPELREKLTVARKKGVVALSRLAEEYPAEGVVLADLSLALAKVKRYEEATTRARSALALDPKLNENPKIAGALYRAAQSQKAQGRVLRLLQGAMGSAGVGIIYDLAHTKALNPRLKRETKRLLSTEELRQAASPAMLLLLDLEAEKSCEKLAPLVHKAALVGDKRALPALKKLKRLSGCGPQKKGDCYACLRDNDELAMAIKTIEQRVTLGAPALKETSGRID